jgi:hypothetical protein
MFPSIYGLCRIYRNAALVIFHRYPKQKGKEGEGSYLTHPLFIVSIVSGSSFQKVNSRGSARGGFRTTGDKSPGDEKGPNGAGHNYQWGDPPMSAGFTVSGKPGAPLNYVIHSRRGSPAPLHRSCTVWLHFVCLFFLFVFVLYLYCYRDFL